MAAETGWCQDKDECVRNNMGLVHGVIGGRLGHRRKKKYAEWGANVGLDRPALEEYGKWGLEEAWAGFDPGHKTQFSTYAVKIIEQKLNDCVVAANPDHESPDAYKRRRAIHAAEERSASTPGRAPTDEEVAFEADLPVEEVVKVRTYSYVASLDETVGDDREDTRADFVEGGDMDEAVEQQESRRKAGGARGDLSSLLEAVGLTPEEQLVLKLRWGLDQQYLEPRPRAKVAQLLAQEHGHEEFVVTGEKRAKNRSKPKYLTDPVRRIELRATRKLERHFADRTGDHGVAP